MSRSMWRDEDVCWQYLELLESRFYIGIRRLDTQRALVSAEVDRELFSAEVDRELRIARCGHIELQGCTGFQGAGAQQLMELSYRIGWFG